ncbi:MAG: hypothetical protein ACXVJ7_03290 [Acidimicrobiia bacterium]
MAGVIETHRWSISPFCELPAGRRVVGVVAPYAREVSARLDPSWTVLASPSTPAVDRCVDIFSRPDGTFGFEEFRRDPEDMGAWTPIAYYSGRGFASEDEATAAARAAVPWLAGVLDGSN